MRKQRVFFCSLLGLMTITCIFWRELSIILVITIAPNHVNCYWSGSSDIMELGQGKWDVEMLIPSRCIFFHETTCSPPNLTPRQACAVESAARNNRNLNVFLLFFATGQLSEKSKRFVEILETYDNVYVRMVRLSSYIIDTPIEDWFWTNIRRYWENYDWLRKDFHDYIRMLTLWKFGGVTLNLNSVVLASLDELTTFAGVQDDRDGGVGVFGVDTSTNFGRKFADACMDIIKNTTANNYSQYNITRIVAEAVWKLCYQRNVTNPHSTKLQLSSQVHFAELPGSLQNWTKPHDEECRQFTIYPPEKFYPTFADSRQIHLNEITAENTVKKGRNAMTIHLPNDYNQNAEADNVAAYKMAARQHCPKIYEFTGENF